MNKTNWSNRKWDAKENRKKIKRKTKLDGLISRMRGWVGWDEPEWNVNRIHMANRIYKAEPTHWRYRWSSYWLQTDQKYRVYVALTTGDMIEPRNWSRLQELPTPSCSIPKLRITSRRRRTVEEWREEERGGKKVEDTHDRYRCNSSRLHFDQK